MQRLLVMILAAFDAVIVVAVGVAVALAPLTLLWVVGVGHPVWSALWPTAGTVWQLGHLVPLSVTLPDEYLALTGIPADAASLTLSLAPLAFAGFTAIFAARSGARAAGAGAWVTGVATGTTVIAVLATVIGVTCRNSIAAVHLWQAVLFPTLIYAVPALGGALVTAWRAGDGGLIDRLHDRVDALPVQWAAAPGLVGRGAAIAVTGLIGLGGLAVAAALLLRGGDVIALFESGHVDALGATVVTLGQIAYLPTLVVWAMAFVAGPGFAVGVGTAVTPAGTQLGVVPAIPILGAVPETISTWLLALAVLPVLIGGVAGWAVRGRIGVAAPVPDATTAVPVHPALVGLLPGRGVAPVEPAPERSPAGLRLAVALGIAAVTAGAAALLAAAASGSLGPGRLSDVGPEPGPVALAVGVEVFAGAAIVLLTTRRVVPRRRDRAESQVSESRRAPVEASEDLLDQVRQRVVDDRMPAADRPDEVQTVTAPLALPDPATLGRHRPAALPPLD